MTDARGHRVLITRLLPYTKPKPLMTAPSSNTFSGARGRVCDKSSLNHITYFQGVTQD